LDNQDLSNSKRSSDLTAESNGLNCKTNSILNSINSQVIENKSVKGSQNGLTNGKVTFTERCKINNDSREAKIRNNSIARLDEGLRELQLDSSQRKGVKNIV